MLFILVYKINKIADIGLKGLNIKVSDLTVN
jgi:hypothetical protein